LPDVIVTKLNAYSGTGAVTLAYSTYLGGSAPDTAAGSRWILSERPT